MAKQRSGCVGCLGMLALLFVFFGFFVNNKKPAAVAPAGQPPAPAAAATEPQAPSPAEVKAAISSKKREVWAYAKEAVRPLLKSPSTADFGSVWGEYQDPDRNVSIDANGIYTVRGWVDATNAFNAKIRTNWIVALKESGNGWVIVRGPQFK